MLVGGVGDCDIVRFGGTQYAKAVLHDLWGLPPALDLDYEKRVQTAVREMVHAGLAESAHDLSDGGLAVALAECSFGRQSVGAEIDLSSGLSPELLLFHEGPSRVLISTAEPERVEPIAARHGVEALRIGVTSEGRIAVRNRGAELIDASVEGLRKIFEGALENKLRV